MSMRIIDSAVVIGSGPAGLCSAIMLVQRGFNNVKLYDKLAEPPLPNSTIWEDLNADRSYNIGINGRGQTALRRFGVMPRIEKYATTVVGRKDWTPETPVDQPRELIFGEMKSYLTKCIQRDRLTACLLETAREVYADKLEIHFNTECCDIEWLKDENQNEIVAVSLSKHDPSGILPPEDFKVLTHFLIGADGATSTVRLGMESEKENGFYHAKYEDKNVRVYRTIPLRFPPNDNKTWRKDVNYSARTKSDVNLDALPTKEGPYVGVVLFRPWDQRVNNITNAVEARAFFDKIFPMFSPFIEDKDLEIFAQKAPSKLPKFSYAGPVLHKGRTTCLIGDSIHTVKPYFGMGVNSAFEDILVLDSCLEKTGNDVGRAIQLYSKQRARDTKALVYMSKRLDGGFFSFVLPLIVDTVLNNVAPWLFSPNSISSLQNEKKSFSQIQARKRLDRVLQVAMGATLLAGLLNGLKILIKTLKGFLLSRLSLV